MLRDYQEKAIADLYDWMRNNKGNPCVVLPTGSGKSHIVAALCKDALQNWPETRILMLTHVKELIEQNAQKMHMHWPNAPLGIYSASMRRRQFDAITFAGVQSVKDRENQLGHVDLIIIDECHLVSHKDEGVYRKLIADMTAINPRMRVIGLTATPWRLGHGRIDRDGALFDGIIEPTTIKALIADGYLATLHSKVTETKISVAGVKKRGGEYIEKDLQAAVDKADLTDAVVDEIISKAEGRQHWLIFCTGVAHSEHVRDALMARGIIAATITGKTPLGERAAILDAFKRGDIQAVTNANVLTTGFDYPDIDLIAMLRPTMSPTLYMQMAGRGLRPKSHTDHCLVLDFAGVVQAHGPITAVSAPQKKGLGNGEAPVKCCEQCDELCHISATECPACGAPFPKPPEASSVTLHGDDIMGLSSRALDVQSWSWARHVSRASGKEMLRVAYYGGLDDKPVREYLTVTHPGYAGDKAISLLYDICQHANSALGSVLDLDAAAATMNQARPPSRIEYMKDGKFDRITRREW